MKALILSATLLMRSRIAVGSKSGRSRIRVGVAVAFVTLMQQWNRNAVAFAVAAVA